MKLLAKDMQAYKLLTLPLDTSQAPEGGGRGKLLSLNCPPTPPLACAALSGRFHLLKTLIVTEFLGSLSPFLTSHAL